MEDPFFDHLYEQKKELLMVMINHYSALNEYVSFTSHIKEFSFILMYCTEDQILNKIRSYLYKKHSKSEKIAFLQLASTVCQTLYYEYLKLEINIFALPTLKSQFNQNRIIRNVFIDNSAIQFSSIHLSTIERELSNQLTNLRLTLKVNCSRDTMLTFLSKSLNNNINIDDYNLFIDDNFTFQNSAGSYEVLEYVSISKQSKSTIKNIIGVFRLLHEGSIISSSKINTRNWIKFNFGNLGLKGLSDSNIWDYLTRDKYSEITQPFRKDFAWIFNKPLI